VSTPDDKDNEKAILKATHSAIDDAVRSHIESVGVDGIVTGWTLTASVASVDDGEEYDGMYTTTSDGLTKWSHVGLLSVALKNAHSDGFLD
jgi:hypothetical protein